MASLQKSRLARAECMCLLCSKKDTLRIRWILLHERKHKLFTSQSELGKVFRQNIRAYNTNFSFTSMGLILDSSTANMTSGVYTFLPRDGQPRHLQLYFYDDQSELSYRLQWRNLDRSIVEILTRVLATNPYAVTFRSLAELGPLDNYRVTLNTSVDVDQRVPGIWIEGNDNITAYREVLLFTGDLTTAIHCSFPMMRLDDTPRYQDMECLLVKLLMKKKTPGNMKKANEQTSTTNISMREYYCYKFQIHPDENVFLFGGRLFQQLVVDTYIKLETTRLEFVERNQVRIRADLYQGVADCVNVGEVQPCRIGQRVVLLASFIGGPRDMRRRFSDAMTLPKIVTKLLPGQTAQDQPNLVAIVFNAKLENLKKQLFKQEILGIVKSYVYLVEF
ncbi:hypothetical protein OSB04_006621 [Centaurea solstitialis]|uniref:Helitron helicase-like domain-containing protein n=1 Tax=Centaurea solstitialis TaxID=347529 RepID=A0AA38TTU2_9ASTR|nr:hypothetical protein OSB04_006621 [Centaurea solstitialis]